MFALHLLKKLKVTPIVPNDPEPIESPDEFPDSTPNPVIPPLPIEVPPTKEPGTNF